MLALIIILGYLTGYFSWIFIAAKTRLWPEYKGYTDNLVYDLSKMFLKYSVSGIIWPLCYLGLLGYKMMQRGLKDKPKPKSKPVAEVKPYPCRCNDGQKECPSRNAYR